MSLSQARCGCGRRATLLCDFWLGGLMDNTCDVALCTQCTTQKDGPLFLCEEDGCVVESIDYCPRHATMHRLGIARDPGAVRQRPQPRLIRVPPRNGGGGDLQVSTARSRKRLQQE